MTITLTHKFVSAIPDGADTSVVRPSNWNDTHDVSGTLPIANGGTNTASVPANGQILIGNGTDYTVANLTAGTGVTITNTAGGITLSAPDNGTVTGVTASSPLASSGGTAPDISLTGTVDVLHGGTGATTLTGYVIGNGTSAMTASTTIPTSNLTGTLPVANGGTGQTTYTDGQLLIGNTTGNTLAKATLTAGTGVTITNGPGTITISAPDTGTVTAVTASSPLASSGGATPNLSLTGTVAIANGGTAGTATPTAGAVPYGTGTAYAFTNAGTTGQVLTSAGAGAPTWTTPTTGTVTSVTASSPLSSSGGATPDLSLTGTVPIANGGTNATATPTAGAIAYGTGSAYAFSLAGTTGQVLTSNGAGAPTWAALSSSAVTSFSAGTTGLTPSSGTTGAVTLAGTLGIANGGTNSTATATAGGIGYGTGTAHAYTAAGTTGQVLTSNGASAPTWAAAATGTVTSVSQTFTGGIISVSGSPIISSGTLALTVTGTAGGVPYFSTTSAWASTAAGTTGQFLKSNGASAPTWAAGNFGTLTTVQKLTSGTSATYTPTAGARYIRVTIKGGGGGGGACGPTPAAGATGGTTSFNSVTAIGGTYDTSAYGWGNGGTGGADNSLVVIRTPGANGGITSFLYNSTTTMRMLGGQGGGNGGGKAGWGSGTITGGAGLANSGGGGGGAGYNAVTFATTYGSNLPANGGGEGETAEFWLPATTYTYTIGAGGAGGTDAGGYAGGAGGSGVIFVEEFY